MEYTRPLTAIRKFCLTCAGSAQAVKDCDSYDCQLKPYRFGKNPYRTPRKLTEEQKAAAAARLKAAREKATKK